ncbi:MAG: hypothetical protein AABY74_09000 [Planctomycetota bacterium]
MLAFCEFNADIGLRSIDINCEISDLRPELDEYADVIEGNAMGETS